MYLSHLKPILPFYVKLTSPLPSSSSPHRHNTPLILSRPAVGLRVSRLTLWKWRMTGREPKWISGTFFYREIYSPITVLDTQLPFPLLSYNTLYFSTLEVPDVLPLITQNTMGKSHSKICVHLELHSSSKDFWIGPYFFQIEMCSGKRSTVMTKSRCVWGSS